MYDLAILGGGPAGVAAGVYAARKRLKTIFIAETVGGQSTDSLEIQNWIGTEKISGVDLGKSLERHLRAYAGDMVDIALGKRIEKLPAIETTTTQNSSAAAATIEKIPGGFALHSPAEYQARTILIATGGSRRKLAVPGAKEFEHKGLTYCASCDGPLFAGQDVVVVGGGNAGFESAAQLLAYCKSVALVHRGSDFSKADATTVASVMAHPNMRVYTNSEPVEVRGNTFVSGLVIKNNQTNETTELPVAGIFVEIGAVPNTTFLPPLIELDALGRVPVDPATQRVRSAGVEVPGLWAAGDVTNGRFHQNNIAAGDAVKALEDIYLYIKSTQH